MIELLILSAVVVVVLGGLVAFQVRSAAAEREEWRQERRFLIDRAIAQHVGEVIALEREDARKNTTANAPEQSPKPLLEGLS